MGITNKQSKEVKETTGVVICERLNVRSRANSNADVVTIIEKGSVVTIDPNTIGNKFYKIRMIRPRTRPLADEVIDGYCMAEFIKINDEPAKKEDRTEVKKEHKKKDEVDK